MQHGVDGGEEVWARRSVEELFFAIYLSESLRDLSHSAVKSTAVAMAPASVRSSRCRVAMTHTLNVARAAHIVRTLGGNTYCSCKAAQHQNVPVGERKNGMVVRRFWESCESRI
jgi:hypothetical protein